MARFDLGVSPLPLPSRPPHPELGRDFAAALPCQLTPTPDALLLLANRTRVSCMPGMTLLYLTHGKQERLGNPQVKENHR